jgi:hypothetical protein
MPSEKHRTRIRTTSHPNVSCTKKEQEHLLYNNKNLNLCFKESYVHFHYHLKKVMYIFITNYVSYSIEMLFTKDCYP